MHFASLNHGDSLKVLYYWDELRNYEICLTSMKSISVRRNMRDQAGAQP